MYTHLYLVDQDLGHMAMGVWGGVFSVVKHTFNQNSLVAQRIKRLPAMRETQVGFLGCEDSLEKEMATHSSILAWRTPWTKDPDKLQPTGLQRVRHD